jgi:hypothetical protein
MTANFRVDLEILSFQLNLLQISEVCKHLNLIQTNQTGKGQGLLFIWATSS